MIMLKVIVMLRWWLKIHCLYGSWLIINSRCQETYICSLAFSKAKKGAQQCFFKFWTERAKKEERCCRCLKKICFKYLPINLLNILHLVSTLERQCICCNAFKNPKHSQKLTLSWHHTMYHAVIDLIGTTFCYLSLRRQKQWFLLDFYANIDLMSNKNPDKNLKLGTYLSKSKPLSEHDKRNKGVVITEHNVTLGTTLHWWWMVWVLSTTYRERVINVCRRL